jgi:DNA topoisomerase-3
MSEQERQVYELIRSHYLAQFLPHHEFDRTQAELECGGQRLTAVGKQIWSRAGKACSTTAPKTMSRAKSPSYSPPYNKVRNAQ